MAKKYTVGRRGFLKQAAVAIGSTTQLSHWPDLNAATAQQGTPNGTPDVSYPRRFTGRQLKMIAFPLGGVAAGSLSLGGRGQLRDWEIFNRPNKGFSPPMRSRRYGFKRVIRSPSRVYSKREFSHRTRARTGLARTIPLD
jgi:hypothetical protein